MMSAKRTMVQNLVAIFRGLSSSWGDSTTPKGCLHHKMIRKLVVIWVNHASAPQLGCSAKKWIETSTCPMVISSMAGTYPIYRWFSHQTVHGCFVAFPDQYHQEALISRSPGPRWLNVSVRGCTVPQHRRSLAEKRQWHPHADRIPSISSFPKQLSADLLKPHVCGPTNSSLVSRIKQNHISFFGLLPGKNHIPLFFTPCLLRTYQHPDFRW